MKKTRIIIVSVLVILALVIIGVVVKNNMNKNSETNNSANSNSQTNNSANNNQTNSYPDKVVIKQYDIYSKQVNNVVKEVTLESQDDIKELSKYVEQLKPLSAEEMVELALSTDVEIKYGETTIGIQLSEEGYCYYKNKDTKSLTLSKMPEGLLGWVEKHLLEE